MERKSPYLPFPLTHDPRKKASLQPFLKCIHFHSNILSGHWYARVRVQLQGRSTCSSERSKKAVLYAAPLISPNGMSGLKKGISVHRTHDEDRIAHSRMTGPQKSSATSSFPPHSFKRNETRFCREKGNACEVHVTVLL